MILQAPIEDEIQDLHQDPEKIIKDASTSHITVDEHIYKFLSSREDVV